MFFGKGENSFNAQKEGHYNVKRVNNRVFNG